MFDSFGQPPEQPAMRSPSRYVSLMAHQGAQTRGHDRTWPLALRPYQAAVEPINR